MALLPCYIISQCLKFASPVSTSSGQSTQWELFTEMFVWVYTGASGHVPMVTESSLTVCPWLHLCASACLCLANYPSGLCYLLSERFTLSPWQPDGHWSGERPQMVISFTRAEGGRTHQTGHDKKVTDQQKARHRGEMGQREKTDGWRNGERR